MMKFTVKKVFEPGFNVVIRNHEDFKILKTKNPENIQVTFLNWTADETALLARKYTNGSNVILNRTPINSNRFPRPYKPNATPAEFKEIKRKQSIANNKTCQEFIKEIYKIITKGYKKDPRTFIDLGFETRIVINAPWLPKTYSIQQAIEGIEEGLAQLNDYTATEAEIHRVNKDCRLYADGIDCYKHTVTTSFAPFDPNEDITYFNKATVVETEYGIVSKWHTVSNYKQPKYYVQTTDEVITWKTEYREKGNTSNQVYCNDVKEHIASDKIKTANEIIDWLAEHDMLDMHAIHCPNCGKPMCVYDGCNHCGYDLPKQAVSEFINGRISSDELSTMQPSEIAEIFIDDDTHTPYAEWQNINDFCMEGEEILYEDAYLK